MSDQQREAQQQIDDLQTQIAFLEDTIGSLDRALSDQQSRIEILEVQVRELATRLREQLVRGDQTDHVDEPPPPHY
jgi:SlyX protein